MAPLRLLSAAARLPRLLKLALLFLKELVVANVRVAATVLFRRTASLAPAIVAVPLDLHTDAGITIFANLVTLTPGTLSIDVSTDRSTLYVHALDVADPETFRRDLKQGLERAVREAFE